QVLEGLLREHVPAALALVAPRVRDVPSLEPPLQPAQLDVREVLEQLERGPARRHPAGPQLRGGQAAKPRGELSPEVGEVPGEHFGVRPGGGGRLGEGNCHGRHASGGRPGAVPVYAHAGYAVAIRKSSPVDMRRPSARPAKYRSPRSWPETCRTSAKPAARARPRNSCGVK